MTTLFQAAGTDDENSEFGMRNSELRANSHKETTLFPPGENATNKNSKERKMIKTERLYITEFTLDMVEAVHLNSLDEDNRKFNPDEVFETMEDAQDTVEFLMNVYENGDGPSVYPVLLTDGTNIGYVQIVPMDDGNYEVGYHIAKAYAGNGYATEAVIGLFKHIKKNKIAKRIFALHDVDNEKSGNVMKRAGMTFEGIMRKAGENNFHSRYDVAMYSILDEEIKI